MSIKVLDPKTVAKIAAGEVVERPSSVVKELVENALDAGSTQISVEIKDGGTGFIRITDNGTGIPSTDVELAFGRHATSKLNRIEDLESIATLGFRGEALASIAAVAEVELVTCTNDAASGDEVVFRDGTMVTHGSRARPRGTTVTVKNLFRSVPARLKFLKSTSTENSHIAAVVSQYALAFPGVRFTLNIDGRNTLRTPGSGSLLDSAIAVFGLEAGSQMVAINRDESVWQEGLVSDIKVEGLVSSPLVSRANRNDLYFFVNHRAINSRILTWAVEEAYKGLLMTGRHPIALVNINLSPAQVDVNVHPTKSEVKFQDERTIFSAVQRAVRATLTTLSPVPKIEEGNKPYLGTRASVPQSLWPVPEKEMSAGNVSAQPPLQSPLHSSLPPLRIIGQVANNYIVAEGPDGAYIIDQHAAHERILYEKIKEQMSRGAIEVQGILTPATLQVTPRQDEALKSSYQSLAEFGFSIEPFGERTYLVRAIPAILSKDDWLAAVRELLDEPLEGNADRLDTMAKSLACHGVIRSGQSLSDDEMRGLLRQLEQAAMPFTCPHGRPTLIHLSVKQLEKEFGRS